MDHEIGLLLDALEASGQAENTIIVFSSDHGDQLFEHRHHGQELLLRALGARAVHGEPARAASSRRSYDELIETVDLMPTLFEFIGLPEPRECQGRSFAPLIADMGRTYEPHDAVFSENIIPEVITGGNTGHAVREGQRRRRHPPSRRQDGPHRSLEILLLPRRLRGACTTCRTIPASGRISPGKPEIHAVEEDLRTRILNWLIDSAETDEIAPRWLLSEPAK